MYSFRSNDYIDHHQSNTANQTHEFTAQPIDTSQKTSSGGYTAELLKQQYAGIDIQNPIRRVTLPARVSGSQSVSRFSANSNDKVLQLFLYLKINK